MSQTLGKKCKVNVDLTRCHGHGRCLEEAPEVFGYQDTSNQAYVLDDADLEANKKAIDFAINACPEAALSWVEE